MALEVPCKAICRGLSDDMQAHIDTGNIPGACGVMQRATEAYEAGQLDLDDYADIRADFFDAYPDGTALPHPEDL